MEKSIQFFFVNEDIQIQIDHKNKLWYDENGKLLLEDVEEFLQEGGFVEDKIGEWRDTSTDKVYELTEVDINGLKTNGWCRMYYFK